MKPLTFDSLAGVLEFLATRRAEVWCCQVLHDEWCAIGLSTPCNCEPHFVVRPGTVENLSRQRHEQAEWLRRRSS